MSALRVDNAICFEQRASSLSCVKAAHAESDDKCPEKGVSADLMGEVDSNGLPGTLSHLCAHCTAEGK